MGEGGAICARAKEASEGRQSVSSAEEPDQSSSGRSTAGTPGVLSSHSNFEREVPVTVRALPNTNVYSRVGIRIPKLVEIISSNALAIFSNGLLEKLLENG